MSIFEEARERAEKGEGAVVGVVAEPGIGKSRLCVEFAERCRADGIEVFEAQAQSHGRSIPFMPVLQMMRAYFGIDGREQGSGSPGRRSRAGRCCWIPGSSRTCRWSSTSSEFPIPTGPCLR